MLVHRHDEGRVAVLSLTNPPANGYSYAMHRELDAHVCDLRMDDNVDVIVIRGAGTKFFCAGADIGYLQSLDPTTKYFFCLHANETLLRLENTPKLIIAALNGHCVGGGLEVALACDLRIGKESGDRPNLVGLPEVSLGVLPGTGGTQRLARIVGRARALHMMIEGKNMSVEQAAEVGLVHAVFPADDWWQQVLAYARSFCAPHKAAGAVGLIKRAVAAGADLPLESGLAIERELQQRLFSSDDAKEGMAAFLGKRSPTFSGRVGPPREAAVGGLAAAPAGGGDSGPPGPSIANPAPPPAPRQRARPDELGAAPAGGGDSNTRAAARPASDSTVARTTAPRGRARAAPPPVGQPSADLGGGAALAAPAKPGSIFDDEPGVEEPEFEVPPPDVDLMYVRIAETVLNLVPTWLVRQFRVIPLRLEGDTLVVALEDPGDTKALAAVKDHTCRDVRGVRADPEAIIARYTMHYRL